MVQIIEPGQGESSEHFKVLDEMFDTPWEDGLRSDAAKLAAWLGPP